MLRCVHVTRARRLRALRHLPVWKVAPEQADWTIARLTIELPELAGEPFARRMLDHLVKGDTQSQVAELLGDTSRRLDPGVRVAFAGLAILLATVASLLTFLILFIAGAFLASGLAIAVLVAVTSVAARVGLRPVVAGWGCVPRRHVKLIEGLVADRAWNAAWAHYCAVRGIALDDETMLIWWVSALREAAHLQDHELRKQMLRDCQILAAIGSATIRGSAMAIGTDLMRKGL